MQGAPTIPQAVDSDIAVGETDIPSPGGSLHVRMADAPVEPIARLAILPGYGDHSGRYVEFMRWMAGRGVSCHAVDFRGHGRSAGRRGFVRRWDEFLDDLRAFLAIPALAGGAGPPLFLLGHSHGGLVAATAGVRGVLPAGLKGCVLVSPYLRSVLRVPPMKHLAGQVANVFVPWLRIRNGLQADMMSSDPAMVEESRRDPLLLRCATPRWYLSTLATQADTRARAADFTLPSLCLAGSADRIADPQATAAFCSFAGSADKTFHLLTDRRHELLREHDRETTFGHVYGWIRQRAGA